MPSNDISTNDASHTKRDREVRRVVLIEGSANALVLLVKLCVGVSSGSLAILSDAIHSFTDVANNCVAWFILRISSRPADQQHPYGHRKFETLAVFFLASFLCFLALELGLHILRTEHTLAPGKPWELGLMIGVLVVNLSLASWEKFKAKQLQSELLKADASHTFADVLTTIAVIVGWQMASRGYPILDKAFGLIVVVLVLDLALQLFKSALPILLDERALDAEKVQKAVLSIDDVQSVRRVRSRVVGNQIFMDLIILVPPELTLDQSHNVADKVEDLLIDEFRVNDISVHVEPGTPAS